MILAFDIVPVPLSSKSFGVYPIPASGLSAVSFLGEIPKLKGRGVTQHLPDSDCDPSETAIMHRPESDTAPPPPYSLHNSISHGWIGGVISCEMRS
jgi:hypothetical protein